jgi:hypothetical protein
MNAAKLSYSLNDIGRLVLPFFVDMFVLFCQSCFVIGLLAVEQARK